MRHSLCDRPQHAYKGMPKWRVGHAFVYRAPRTAPGPDRLAGTPKKPTSAKVRGKGRAPCAAGTTTSVGTHIRTTSHPSLTSPCGGLHHGESPFATGRLAAEYRPADDRRAGFAAR